MKSLKYFVVALVCLIGNSGCENQDMILCEESYKMVETLAFSQEQEIADLQKQRQADQARLQELQEELAQREEQRSTAAKGLANSRKALANKIASARQHGQQLEAQITELKSSLALSRQEQSRLQGELDEARQQIKGLGVALARMKQAALSQTPAEAEVEGPGKQAEP